MYYSYSYHNMKPKPDKFRSSYVSSTSNSTYDNWKFRLEGSGAGDWQRLTEQWAEDLQLTLLCGLTIAGVAPYDWDDIFRAIRSESAPFQGFSKWFLQGQFRPNWHYFAHKVVQETYKSVHYPPVCPEWLWPYGYSQPQYLADLAVYWDNIHDDYYKLWDTTRLGQDSPEVARLRWIGQEARREIDQVARHSARHLKR